MFMGTMNETPIKPRRAWIAILLSLVSIPAAYLYSGHLKRALALTFIWMLLVPIAMLLACKLPLPRIGLFCLAAFCLAFPIIVIFDVYRLTRSSQPAPLKPFQRWWVYLLAFLCSAVLIELVLSSSRSYIAEAFFVPGRAMAPTINHHDRILVDKLGFDPSLLRRNDLAVFVNTNSGSQLNVMRIVGLPGETIEVREERLFIDGVQAADPHAHFVDDSIRQSPEMVDYGPIQVPAKCYFVLGDNRRRSRDSRIDGPVPFDDFRAVARLIYWSNDYTFPTSVGSKPECGKIRWDRIGIRLDGQ